MRLARAFVVLVLAPLASAQPDSLETVVQPLIDGIQIHLVAGPPQGRSVCNTWHGIDGGEPERVVLEGWVERYGERLDLDVSCMASAFGPHLYGLEVETDSVFNNLVVRGTFGDGAGTARVEWIVGPRGTVRTGLVSGPDLFTEDEGAVERLTRDLYLGLTDIIAAPADGLEDRQAGEVLALVVAEAERLVEVLDELTDHLDDM